MNIKAYLKKHEMSQADFAKKMAVTQGLVWQWLNGHTKVTAERAVEIERCTAGEITRHDLRPDLFPRAAAA